MVRALTAYTEGSEFKSSGYVSAYKLGTGNQRTVELGWQPARDLSQKNKVEGDRTGHSTPSSGLHASTWPMHLHMPVHREHIHHTHLHMYFHAISK